MKKKLILSIWLLTLSIVVVFAQDTQTKSYFKGKQINGLIINGAFDVQLSQGQSTGLSVKLMNELVDKLEVSITENNYIRLSFSNDALKYFKNKKKPLAKIVVSSLEMLHVSGNVSVICKGEFSAKDFDLDMCGMAYVDFLKVNCENAHLEFKGNSNIEDSKVVAAQDVEVEVGEAGNPNIGVECEKLKITAGGPSNLKISGTASKSASVRTSGTCKVSMLSFVTPSIKAIVSDVSRLHANVTGELDLTKSGMAAFRYIGDGKINGEGAKPL